MEIKVWNKMNHGCCLARVISSGSKGMFDIWSLQWDKLRVAVCRTNGYLTKTEKQKLAEFMINKPSWVQVEVWWYRSKKKMTKTILKNAEQVVAW